MNRPFSFRSRLTSSDASGDLLATPALAVKIHWAPPTEFALVPLQGSVQRCSFEGNGLQMHLLARNRRDTSHRAPKLRLLRAFRSALLAVAFVPFLCPAQSLWKEEVSKPMFADKRAAGIGDILTILVQETTSTSKDNKTATGKESGLDASLATFLYSPAASGLLTKGGQMPALKFNSKSDFTGGGSINNSEKLSARAAVQVKDVLPNRNLVVEGRRETSVGGEHQTMILHGVVRPEDVLANNTIYSYNVAEATIEIISKGTLTDSQRKGWFQKLWDKLAPF